MKKTLFSKLIFCFIFIPGILLSLDNHWENFTAPEEYSCITETNKSIWIGSRGGLIEYNKLNGENKVHTKASISLPSNYIIALETDKNDNLWIGTFDGGLAMYDGVSMKIFNTNNSILPSDIIRSIDIDKNGIILISTDKGLAKFDYPNNNWTIMTQDNGLPAKAVYDCKIDTSGTMWVSGNTGLLCYKNETWKIYNSLDYDFYWDICDGGIHIDKKNQVWIGTGLGLLKYNQQLDTFELISIGDGEGNNMFTYITSIYEDSDLNIWVTSLGARLAKYDGHEWTFMTSDNYKELDKLRFFHIDNNNNKWTGGDKHLYKMSDGTTFNEININYSGLASNHLNGIFVDKLGKAWILTKAHGVNSFHNGIWESYTYENSKLPSNWSTCACEDKEGGIWIGTSDLNEEHEGGGLMYIGKENQIKIIKENDISSNHINAIACDSKNRIWVGTRNGIFVYNAYNQEMLTNIANIGQDVRGICINSKDDVYVIINYMNIYMFKNGQWSPVESGYLGEDEGLLRSLAVDSKDTLYALYDRGLWKNINNNWEKINKLNEIAPPNGFYEFNNLCIDKNDEKWIASNYYGVIRNTKDDWQVLNIMNSKIIANYIAEVFVDNKNNVWYASSTFGLAVNYSDNLGIDDLLSLPCLQNVSVFPNPCINEITLNFDLIDLANINIRIFDLLGNHKETLISSIYKKGKYSEKFQFSNYSSGIYYIEIKVNNKSRLLPLNIIR